MYGVREPSSTEVWLLRAIFGATLGMASTGFAQDAAVRESSSAPAAAAFAQAGGIFIGCYSTQWQCDDAVAYWNNHDPYFWYRCDFRWDCGGTGGPNALYAFPR